MQSQQIYQQPQSNKLKKKKKWLIISISVVVLILAWAGLTRAGVITNFLGLDILCSEKEVDYYPIYVPSSGGGSSNSGEVIDYKPIIYLYPTQPQEVKVTLDYPGEVFVTYPEYNKGWEVLAQPNGDLTNLVDNREYSYLFWEGNDSHLEYDLNQGFIVKGEDTVEFLQDKLSHLGLTPREYNEFIVFWYPKMMNNKYNLIHFATPEEYDNKVILKTYPKADSTLRVFMVYKALDKKIDMQPQELSTFERNGFSVVEWGGSEVR